MRVARKNIRMKWRMAVISAGLFACGIFSTHPAFAIPPTDACSLLTPAQVSWVLGFSAKPGHMVKSDETECDWPMISLAKMNSKDTKVVEVKILGADGWALLAPAAATETPLAGIGDKAFYGGDSDLMALYVKKGNVQFYVSVRGFPLDQIKEKEKRLAKDALAKL